MLNNQNPRIVILYSSGLQSYMLYSELVRNYSNYITCMIKLPVIPKKKKVKSNIKRSLLSRLLWKTSIAYIFFNFVITIFYELIAFFSRTRLQDLAKRLKIPVYNYKYISEDLILHLGKCKPEWILNGSPNILKKTLLSIPSQGVLNYHCAPLPEYRGAANYFWLLYEGEQHTKATIHYVDEGLDTGDIISYSDEILITSQMTVFQLWFQLRYLAYPCFEKNIDYLIGKKERMPSFIQEENKGKTRSFPDKRVSKKIKKMGHCLINMNDIISIIRVGITGNIRPNKNLLDN